MQPPHRRRESRAQPPTVASTNGQALLCILMAFEQCSLRPFPTVVELSTSLGAFVVEKATAAIAERGRFMFAVSGGSVVEVRVRGLVFATDSPPSPVIPHDWHGSRGARRRLLPAPQPSPCLVPLTLCSSSTRHVQPHALHCRGWGC